MRTFAEEPKDGGVLRRWREAPEGEKPKQVEVVLEGKPDESVRWDATKKRPRQANPKEREEAQELLEP